MYLLAVIKIVKLKICRNRKAEFPFNPTLQCLVIKNPTVTKNNEKVQPSFKPLLRLITRVQKQKKGQNRIMIAVLGTVVHLGKKCRPIRPYWVLYVIFPGHLIHVYIRLLGCYMFSKFAHVYFQIAESFSYIIKAYFFTSDVK